MATFFEKGEVVWGKIKGYPYWPAIITDFNNNLIYTIKFYNDNSYAKLSSKFLLKYQENKNKIIESNRKNKKLLGAIKSADIELKKNNGINKINKDNNNFYETNGNESNKIKIDTENIQIKSKDNSNQDLEPKNLEINNKEKINNLSNKLDIMSGQNNRVNIFSIIKNTKNIINMNNPNSLIMTPTGIEENNIDTLKNNCNLETNNNNNDIFINKNVLNLDKDGEMDLLLPNNKNMDIDLKETDKEKGKKYKKFKKLKKKRKMIEKSDTGEISQEKYLIKVEIENLEAKNYKKKEIKKKIDNKIKEEKKKREEEDNFIYQIDEYFYKIFELYNTKKFDKLDYEKEHFKKVLLFLSKYKRPNFFEFLKMNNISKYIQYFTCYLKSYDSDLNNLVKKVYNNFLKQFNREFYNNENK